MQVIRKINNNAAVCLDSAGNEMIAIARGIGYPPVPYELTDLSKVDRTYYAVEPAYVELLAQIPSEVFEVAQRVVDVFRAQVNPTISSNVVFALADHLSFAIDRQHRGIRIGSPLELEVQHLYPAEYEIGQLALRLVRDDLREYLPKSEAANIALHLINAEAVAAEGGERSTFEETLEDALDIIQEHYGIVVDRDDVNYSRFVSHFRYFMRNVGKRSLKPDEAASMLRLGIQEMPQAYACVEKLGHYLHEQRGIDLIDEEELYLTLHVHRICNRREDDGQGPADVAL